MVEGELAGAGKTSGIKTKTNGNKRKNRRSLRKDRINSCSTKLKLVGVNCAGLTSKLESLNYLLGSVRPSIFFLQETKRKKQGGWKIQNGRNYQIFELLRKEKVGGGLAIGVVPELNPVWISEGNDEVEVLVVQVEIQQLKLRCLTAYGPQENHLMERKVNFWARMAQEVQNALEFDTALLIQMDGNLWAGEELVKGDPNKPNCNGKLFMEFLKQFPHLTVVNSLPVCEGVVTRRRKHKNKVEEAVLHFYIVCDKLKKWL